jgi:hypothetical protein
MWVCLGQTRSRWGPVGGPQSPGRMRSANKRNGNMGRPKRTEARTKQLNLSLTTCEWESIRQRAQVLGMRPAHFGRAVLLDQERTPTAVPQPESQFDRLVYGALSRLGNNLNQLLRHLHQTGDPIPPDLEPLLRDIRHIIARRVQR